jgi:hypothetical protein
MPAQQLMIGQIGIKKQSAKGTPGVSPALYGFGLTGGKVANVALTQAPDAITVAGTSAIGRVAPSASRTDAGVAWSFSTLAYPRSLSMMLYAVSGGYVFAGGTPNTHTITPAMTLPYFTLFGKMGNLPMWSLASDCLFDEVTLSWDGRTAPQVSASVAGLAINPSGSSFTVTNDELTQPYFTPPNTLASYQLSVASATVAAAQVTGASLHWSNSLKPVQLSKSVIADDMVPGLQQLDGSITIIPNDYTDLIKAWTGTGTGTSISNSTVYGSFSLKLAIDANTDLTIGSVDKVAWTADLSDIDPSGGPMPVTLNFTALGATAPYTITAHNTAADLSA